MNKTDVDFRVMMSESSGKAKFTARARILSLLGEQLITDEVAAISELIKNSYDADSKKVVIKLDNVSDRKIGTVTIIDKGMGIDKDILLKSWMELGTLSKARGKDNEIRKSPGGRVYLGEKGLGRLAIHKLGKQTALVSRQENSNNEITLVLDWSPLENSESYLNDIEFDWKQNEPIVFGPDNEFGFEHGTKIMISKLHNDWKEETIEKIKRFVNNYQLPIAALKDFEVQLIVNDPLDKEIEFAKQEDILKTAHYVFNASVDKNGILNYKYIYNSKLRSHFNRQKEHSVDLLEPEEFPEDRKPICGPFKFTIYCWDLDHAEKKATFASEKYWREIVRPLTGFKLFRDGFRVLPYGNQDNDWLNMDQSRVQRFQENVSRNQVIAFVEITSNENMRLSDKSDREGLVDNMEFRDFKYLVLSALDRFQTERNVEREKIKKENRENLQSEKFREILNDIVTILNEEITNPKAKEKILKKMEQSRMMFGDLLREAEEPLLGAASIGASYIIPTHEIKRNIREVKRILMNFTSENMTTIQTAIKILVEVENELKGVVKIAQTVIGEEEFDIRKPFETAIELMQYRLARNNIEFQKDFRLTGKIKGTERLLTMAILNFIDNSIYWLGKKKDDKKIKFIIAPFKNYIALVVSDNGPGIDDDVEIVSLPFYTRKAKGMGMGLFISKRAAEMHDGKLSLFDKTDLPNMLSGANIGLLLPAKMLT